jgi:hypothetical protein
MWWMVKDSKGNKSATLTFAVVGMVVSSLALLASLVKTISVGDVDIAFQSIDSTLVLGYMGATVTAYIIRRNKADQIESDEKNGVVR